MAKRIPSLTRHKPTNRARVRIKGRDIYLGPWGSEEAERNYQRIVHEYAGNGYTLIPRDGMVTVAQLIAAYWEWAEMYFVDPAGKPRPELSALRTAFQPLNHLYGDTLTYDFRPVHLKAVREALIARGLKRRSVNDHAKRIRRVFRWGVENELVPPDVLQRLEAVAPLKRGRCEAPESEPVRPVALADVDAVRPHVSRQVQALIDLQLHTAARPSELLMLRPVDVDRSGDLWIAAPANHKNTWRGKERRLVFGPRAQRVLAQFLDRPDDYYLFSPRDAAREAAAQCLTHRRPDQKPNRRKTARRLGNHYTKDSYRRAIVRVCEDLDIDRWTPYRLRHTAATMIRERWGLEAAQVMLGHEWADVTQVYAERNMALAMEVARAMG